METEGPRDHGHHHGDVLPDPWHGADCLRGSFLKICFVFIVLFLKWGWGGGGGDLETEGPRDHGHHHGDVLPDPWHGADCLGGSFLKIIFFFNFNLEGEGGSDGVRVIGLVVVGGGGEGGWKPKNPEIMDIIMKEQFCQTHGLKITFFFGRGVREEEKGVCVWGGG